MPAPRRLTTFVAALAAFSSTPLVTAQGPLLLPPAGSLLVNRTSYVAPGCGGCAAVVELCGGGGGSSIGGLGIEKRRLQPWRARRVDV